MILEELWADHVCKSNLLALVSPSSHNNNKEGQGQGQGQREGGEALRDYLLCLLSSLVHSVKDSLGRLSDVLMIQEAKEAAAWQALTPTEQATKETFGQSQGKMAKGFLSLGKDNMRWLSLLVSNEGVRECLVLDPEALKKAAFVTLRFVQMLVGPMCEKMEGCLKPSPQEYNFVRIELLEGVVKLMISLNMPPPSASASPAKPRQPFVQALLEEQDLDLSALRAATTLIQQGRLVSISDGWEALVNSLFPSHHESPSGDQGNGEAMELDWKPACYSLDLFPNSESSSLEESYSKLMLPLALGEFESSRPKAYNRAFLKDALEMSSGESSSAAKVKRITKEFRDLRSGKTPLPCYATGSIFIRHDQERLDVMRCLISGPEDTPYEGGLFVFDVLLPEGYPAVPPQMKLETTGGGRVRFNPNLYEDGKICLSLLGTFHGGHESEKWNPQVSSIYQLVLSIQSQLLVRDPIYNEPAVSAMQGTKEGDQKSLSYNAELKLSTLRFAINEMISSPPIGFEDVVRGHFLLLKRRVMEAGKRWVEEAGREGMPPQLQAKMDAEVCKLHQLLSEIKPAAE